LTPRLTTSAARIGDLIILFCTTLFQENLDKWAPQRLKTVLDFNEARDDGVVVASAGQYAAPHHSFLQAFLSC